MKNENSGLMSLSKQTITKIRRLYSELYPDFPDQYRQLLLRTYWKNLKNTDTPYTKLEKQDQKLIDIIMEDEGYAREHLVFLNHGLGRWMTGFCYLRYDKDHICYRIHKNLPCPNILPEPNQVESSAEETKMKKEDELHDGTKPYRFFQITDASQHKVITNIEDEKTAKSVAEGIAEHFDITVTVEELELVYAWQVAPSHLDDRFEDAKTPGTGSRNPD